MSLYLSCIKSPTKRFRNSNNLIFCCFLGSVLAMAGCAKTEPLDNPATNKITQVSTTNTTIEAKEWRLMTAEESKQNWKYILNSPLGIGALNQLAIEGFISPNCPKSFYVSQEYGSFQTLLQVKCSSPRGISIATAYQEMRIIFNRFEDNIESFEVKRIYVSQ